jgi:hypothetical protein
VPVVCLHESGVLRVVDFVVSNAARPGQLGVSRIQVEIAIELLYPKMQQALASEVILAEQSEVK